MWTSLSCFFRLSFFFFSEKKENVDSSPERNHGIVEVKRSVRHPPLKRCYSGVGYKLQEALNARAL